MRPRAAKALKVMGTTWCVFVVLGYLAVWLFSEHGGGLFSQEGWGEVWLIALVCLPGVGLIKLADRMSGLKAEQPSQLRMQQDATGVGYPVSNAAILVDESMYQSIPFTMDTHFGVERDVYFVIRCQEWADHEAAGRVFGGTIPDGRRFVYVERTCTPVMAAIREYHAKRSGREKEWGQRPR